MTLAERYRGAVEVAHLAAGDEDILLPKVLARASVEVLPFEGAGISTTSDLRVPLGSSDATAALAEQLQTTLGDGPCLTAAQSSRPLAAGLGTIAEEWPVFHAELIRHTPYRSVAALPLLTAAGLPFAALDLYSVRSEAVNFGQLHSFAAEVAAPIRDMLGGGEASASSPSLLAAEPARARARVWTAVGMLLARTKLDNPDALALLRAHAFGTGLTLDVVAARLVDGELDPDLIIEDPASA